MGYLLALPRMRLLLSTPIAYATTVPGSLRAALRKHEFRAFRNGGRARTYSWPSSRTSISSSTKQHSMGSSVWSLRVACGMCGFLGIFSSEDSVTILLSYIRINIDWRLCNLSVLLLPATKFINKKGAHRRTIHASQDNPRITGRPTHRRTIHVSQEDPDR